MKYYLLPLCLLVSLPVSLHAQEISDSLNLIENGSFEEFSGKLKRLGSIEMATGWKSPTEAKADLFTESVAGAPVSAPRNQFGDQTALSGTNYAGVLWWSYMNKEPRTYLQAKFKKPLKKGQKYCVRYYASLSDLSKYGSNELGAYVSKMMVKKTDEGSLTYPAQIPNLRTTIFSDQFTWQGVCGPIEGTGDEAYLIIGNFEANEKVNTEKMKRAKGETRPQIYNAYYFIDDVAVWPIKSLSECKCEQIDEAESEFIYGRTSTVKKTLPPATRLDQTVIYYKRFQQGVDASMDMLVAEMASIMNTEQSLKIRLVGHTDAIEADRVRMRPDLTELAKDRATTLKNALVEEGIAADRITVAGVGAESPASEGDDEVSMSRNRRVEVEMVK